MKKILAIAIVVFFLRIPVAFAQEQMRIDITPQPCMNRAGCPIDLIPAYDAEPGGAGCVTDINQFAAHPSTSHYWIEDPKITEQGKADERARQFIYWTLSTRSLDDSPVLKNVWKLTSNITYFLVLFVAAMLGIGLIIGQRMRFETKVKIWPTVMKVVGILIYIAFSAAIIILLIQLSEILMKFFLETLGGKDFFNIYFSTNPNDQINQQNGAGPGVTGGAATGSSESNYIGFIGCRDLNTTVQESVHAELFLFKATNITYYVMGVMILLRKVLLWFLLFVSPFAAILIPFVFIRNTAWIWLGVFFQWLFYGPLFALFLGATATIWKQGIPFLFDFSRVHKLTGYVYPTAINITYGGPAQHLGALNNGNYVDTFSEYIITLIMLWAAIIFPWWLLRIFRDYCCDYLMAMKNILLNMYDQMRVTNGPQAPGPIPPTRGTSTSQTLVNNSYKTLPTSEHRLETMQEIRNTTTQNILKTVNIAAPKLTDIANFETNKAVQQSANKNIEFLRNPMKADTPVERQKYMNIRTELLNRALKEDKLAKQVLSSVSTSFVDQRENKSAISNQVYNAVSKAADNTQVLRENIAREVISKVGNQQFDRVVEQSNTSKESVIKTVLENTPAQQSISSVVSMPQSTVNSVTNAITNSISNFSTINQIAQKSNVDNESVQQIYQTYQQNSTQSPSQVFQTIANNQSVSNALQKSLSTNTQMISQVSNMTNVSTTDVQKISQALSSATSQATQVNESTVIENVAHDTSVEREKVREVITAIKTHEKTGAIGSDTITNISNQTNVPAATVQNIANSYQTNKQPATQIVNQISTKTQIEKEKVQKVIDQITSIKNEKVREVLNQIKDTAQQSQTASNIITSVAQTTQVSQPVIQQILQSWNQNINQNPTQIINTITNDNKVSTSLNSSIANNSESINSISNKTGVEGPNVQNITQVWNKTLTQTSTTAPSMTERYVIEKSSNETQLSKEKVTEVLSQIRAHEKEGAIGDTTITNISSTTGVPVTSVQNVVTNLAATTVQSPAQIVERVSQQTQLEKEKVQEIITRAETIQKANPAVTITEIVNTVSTQANVQAPVAERVVNTWREIKSQQSTSNITERYVVEKLSHETQMTKEKIREVLTQIQTHEKEGAVGDTTITNISSTSGIPAATVQNIINTWNETKAPASGKMSETQIIETISRETHLDQVKVREVVRQITEMKKDKVREVIKEVHGQISKDKTLVRQIAKQHNIKEEEVQKIADAQKAIVSQTAATQAIEKKITLPATVSIEEYEGVKKMWQKQYESGEIPVQENIQSRSEWVDHDIVFITNALNKLMSEDELVRQQGLDDIGYILPIFMINNFKGEELLVYLKAKLEAAKAVQEQLEREEALKAELTSKSDEEQVEVSNKKEGEQEKTMEMSQEMTIDGDESTPPTDQNSEGAAPQPTTEGEPNNGNTSGGTGTTGGSAL